MISVLSSVIKCLVIQGMFAIFYVGHIIFLSKCKISCLYLRLYCDRFVFLFHLNTESFNNRNCNKIIKSINFRKLKKTNRSSFNVNVTSLSSQKMKQQQVLVKYFKISK